MALHCWVNRAASDNQKGLVKTEQFPFTQDSDRKWPVLWLTLKSDNWRSIPRWWQRRVYCSIPSTQIKHTFVISSIDIARVTMGNRLLSAIGSGYPCGDDPLLMTQGLMPQAMRATLLWCLWCPWSIDIIRVLNWVGLRPLALLGWL